MSSSKPSPQPPEKPLHLDLGFGRLVSAESRRRLLNRDGSFNVDRIGLGVRGVLNLYHQLLTITWPRFVLLVVLAFVLTNLSFAVVFVALGETALEGAPEEAFGGHFGRAFFFSVHTLTGVGYGHVTAVGLWANIVAAVASIAGLFFVALMTGLSFARFARPTAQVRFSRNALIAPYQGMTAFEFRLVNLRRHDLLNVSARVLFACRTEEDGRITRHFHELPLERTQVMFLPLSWTVVHPIGEDSPLYGMTAEDLTAGDAEFLVMLEATDETFAATVHARTSYKPQEIVWGARFVRIFTIREDQPLEVDVARLDEYESTA